MVEAHSQLLMQIQTPMLPRDGLDRAETLRDGPSACSLAFIPAAYSAGSSRRRTSLVWPSRNPLQRQHHFEGYRDLDRLNPVDRGIIECLRDMAPCLLGTILLG